MAMKVIDESCAECVVLTEKEGLLSTMAHDLRLRVASFRVELEPGLVRARFEPSSLRVVCAMRGGQDDPSALSAKDRAEIEANLRNDVLHAERHREIAFVAPMVSDAATASERSVRGKLTLHGVTREVDVRVAVHSDRAIAEARIHQPDFGIKPYSALFGALKVKADVRVRLSAPLVALAS